MCFFFLFCKSTINFVYLICVDGAAGNHVALSDVNHGVAKVYKNQVENEAKELFLPFRAFCTRKEVSLLYYAISFSFSSFNCFLSLPLVLFIYLTLGLSFSFGRFSSLMI